MQPLALAHCFTRLRSLGGVESILHRHHAADEAGGLASKFVLFFEDRSLDIPRAAGLGWNGCTTIRQARRSFAGFMAKEPPPIALYHNLWGVPFLAELDQSRRRLGMLHSDWPGLEENLRAHCGLLDGVLCVSEALRAMVLRQLPELEPERVEVIPYPITAHPPAPPRAPLGRRPWVIGCCGRLIKEQKRVDRFPAFARQLEQAGLDFRLEFLGTGPEEDWLRRQFPDPARAVFHGRKSGQDYHTTLAGWDAIVFLSDYEGLPIALLEALQAGVLPLFPKVGSGGDAFARQIRPELLYPPGDLAAMVCALQQLQQLPDGEIQALRERGRELTAPHREEFYFNQFNGFVRRISAAPRISQTTQPRRPFFFTDHWPFALLRRVRPRGFYRRNDGSLSP
ncbi:MAG: glycosyltransferase family 4 protein [Verrucomicrobia bacterium]|nr:glycosyltransferase family 4 protein [Verrucomicrobiota bacterium]